MRRIEAESKSPLRLRAILEYSPGAKRPIAHQPRGVSSFERKAAMSSNHGHFRRRLSPVHAFLGIALALCVAGSVRVTAQVKREFDVAARKFRFPFRARTRRKSVSRRMIL